MKAMMLTAGEGTRLRPHTLFLPKPAIPFLNVPLYAYSLQLLKSLKINEVVMNTFHLPAKLKSVVNSRLHPYPIKFSDEAILQGSGGGLGQARGHFLDQGELVLMNGDEVVIPKKHDVVSQALAEHKASGAIATLLVTEHPEVGTKFGGVWIDRNSNILGFGKQKAAGSQKGFHYVGIALFSDVIFNFITPGESNILYDGLTQALKEGHTARVFPIDCHWFETGNEQDFRSATRDCLQILSTKSVEAKYLKDILNEYAPDSIYENSGGQTFLIDKNAKYHMEHISGYVVLGPRATVGSSCRIKNCILGPGVQVTKADLLEDKMIINDQDVL